MRRIAVIGGGMAGVTAAYLLGRAASEGAAVEVQVFEASDRLGGIVETVREGGFTVECGPDGWVSEKPWALELARELGLQDEVIPSLDAGRKTYVLLDGALRAMPDGMRMMVPSDLDAVDRSELFSEGAKRAFREEIGRAEELRARAPKEDESVASFVERHFGREVLERIAAPLLSGVFAGDVRTLSVRAVMPAFVAMERQFGSLILAVQAAAKREQKAVFTTLRSGVGELVDRMVAATPASWFRLREEVVGLARSGDAWIVRTKAKSAEFDRVLLAAPVDVARALVRSNDLWASELMEMEASSSVIVAFCFGVPLKLPQGFGFLVPPDQGSRLLACTFTGQKFEGRVPAGNGMLRGFFGGAAAERMMGCGNDEIAAVARLELGRILGPLPEPVLTVVRRWPRALPQYGVGHLERMDVLHARVRALGGLWLLGNGYRGVGLPDLVREARHAVGEVLAG